jgi:hypothetical protein
VDNDKGIIEDDTDTDTVRSRKHKLVANETKVSQSVYLLRSIYIGCSRLTLGFRGPQLYRAHGSSYDLIVNSVYIYIYIYIYIYTYIHYANCFYDSTHLLTVIP